MCSRGRGVGVTDDADMVSDSEMRVPVLCFEIGRQIATGTV